jgi:hypothetical protein
MQFHGCGRFRVQSMQYLMTAHRTIMSSAVGQGFVEYIYIYICIYENRNTKVFIIL